MKVGGTQRLLPGAATLRLRSARSSAIDSADARFFLSAASLRILLSGMAPTIPAAAYTLAMQWRPDLRRRWLRARSRLRRAATRSTGGRTGARLISLAVCVLAGFMIATSAINAGGSDLRPNRNTDLAGLIESEARHNRALADRIAALRRDVDALAKPEGTAVPADALQDAAALAGQTPVRGPAVVVSLDDAPSGVAPQVSPELLVVHQQDIQAVVNALWSGGAEAMTIQGQRVTSRTGVKCVGNSVVLHGVPYAPPYEIVAIGDQGRLELALAGSSALQVYRQYMDAYGLGYTQRREADVTLPAYRGSLDIEARRIG